MKESKY